MRIVLGLGDVHCCCDKGGIHVCLGDGNHVKREETHDGVAQVLMQRLREDRCSETFRWDCCCYFGFHFGTLPSRWGDLASNWKTSAVVTRWESRC